MAGPDVGTRPSKRKTIKQGTPSHHGGSGMTGASLKSLGKTAWVQSGGAHRAAYKTVKGAVKSVVSDPKKAAKTVVAGNQAALQMQKSARKKATSTAKSGWERFKRGANVWKSNPKQAVKNIKSKIK